MHTHVGEHVVLYTPPPSLFLSAGESIYEAP